jgi:hypothetical protein
MNQIEICIWRQSCQLFIPKSPIAFLDMRYVGRVYHKGRLLGFAECVGFCVARSQAVVWTVAVVGLRLVHKLMQKLP